MDTTQLITLIAIALYFLGMIGIGYIASKDQAHKGFEIGSRNVGYIPTIGSIAISLRDGAGVIFWFGFGATAGYGGIWFLVGVLAALLVYTYIGPKVRKKSKEKDYITMNEMLRARFGVITERVAGLITLFFAFAIVAIQLYVTGNVFSAILGIDAWIGVASAALIVGFYLYSGGYNCN